MGDARSINISFYPLSSQPYKVQTIDFALFTKEKTDIQRMPERSGHAQVWTVVVCPLSRADKLPSLVYKWAKSLSL